jgi:hypothetical protein
MTSQAPSFLISPGKGSARGYIPGSGCYVGRTEEHLIADILGIL